MTNYLQIMYKKISIKIIIILVTAAIVTVPSSMLQLSDAQPNQDMQEVLNIHNRERTEVNFPVLTWSDSLAADAQKWADHLATLGIVCGPGGCKPTTPHGATNENIASGYVYPAELGRTSPAEFAQMWADEKVAYNGGQRSGLGIGHYCSDGLEGHNPGRLRVRPRCGARCRRPRRWNGLSGMPLQPGERRCVGGTT